MKADARYDDDIAIDDEVVTPADRVDASRVLTLLVGLYHFRLGVQVVLEDYAHGTPRRVMIIAAICVTYAILAIGLFAVARIAL